MAEGRLPARAQQRSRHLRGESGEQAGEDDATHRIADPPQCDGDQQHRLDLGQGGERGHDRHDDGDASTARRDQQQPQEGPHHQRVQVGGVAQHLARRQWRQDGQGGDDGRMDRKEDLACAQPHHRRADPGDQTTARGHGDSHGLDRQSGSESRDEPRDHMQIAAVGHEHLVETRVDRPLKEVPSVLGPEGVAGGPRQPQPGGRGARHGDHGRHGDHDRPAGRHAAAAAKILLVTDRRHCGHRALAVACH
ncbi:hypothetical protein [Microbacterium sp. MYb64]|uniref:hypothetical protein n=1 Tax=Microbacterium sp. MYb64 TaxID=1848691 RepID=UPI0015E36FBE|nr:hypothetical protein [Microbacterium sp. MYb64]